MRYDDSRTQKRTDASLLTNIDPLVPEADEHDDEWPITRETPAYGELDFYPIPGAWLDANRAFDQGVGENRIYATSAAVHGGWIVLRYVHARLPKVQFKKTSRCRFDGGWIPRALTREATSEWPRSTIPTRDPQDLRQSAERDHMVDIWSERADEVATEEEMEQIIADGGITLFEEGEQ